MIKALDEISNFEIFLDRDTNGRQINIYKLEDCVSIGCSNQYPNVLLYSHNDQSMYQPIKESIMSLNGSSVTYTTKGDTSYTNRIEEPVFFFIYNTDNYYHFVYDTLPYLITFFELRKRLPGLKLLMGNESKSVDKFYRFVTEFLELCDIAYSDIIFIDSNTLYKNIYISTSYTHDFNSNYPPRNEIYDFYDQLVSKAGEVDNTPKKIYISRRSWIYNDVSNIGTNYTTRRKLFNEDELVNLLHRKNYTEVFTESLTTLDKLNIFSKASKIVGAIGGGLCNALFSPPSTELVVLVSPTFFDKHERFKYSFKGKQTTYFTDAYHTEPGYWKKYMRVKIPEKNIIGEIEDIEEDNLIVSYTDIPVAGWNNAHQFQKKIFNKSECVRVDSGLNCGWKIDIDKIEHLL